MAVCWRAWGLRRAAPAAEYWFAPEASRDAQEALAAGRDHSFRASCAAARSRAALRGPAECLATEFADGRPFQRAARLPSQNLRKAQAGGPAVQVRAVKDVPPSRATVAAPRASSSAPRLQLRWEVEESPDAQEALAAGRDHSFRASCAAARSRAALREPAECLVAEFADGRSFQRAARLPSQNLRKGGRAVRVRPAKDVPPCRARVAGPRVSPSAPRLRLRFGMDRARASGSMGVRRRQAMRRESPSARWRPPRQRGS
jgi:hypothetical protein